MFERRLRQTEIRIGRMDGVLVQSTLNLYPLSGVQLSAETSDRLTKPIDGLILGRVPFRQCLDESSLLTGLQGPIERLRTILSVPDAPPIPESQERDRGARKRNRMWTPPEDARLLAAIHRYGVENWRIIAQFVGNNRSCGQCSQRWFRVLDPRLSHSRWTGLEELRLLQLVRYCGDRSWTQIAAQMGNRSDVQCRYHYRRMLAEAPARRRRGIRTAESGTLPPSSQLCQGADGGLKPSRSVPVLPANGSPKRPRLAEQQSGSAEPEFVFDLVERLSAVENDSMKAANWY
jgi:hypothetical protein